MDARSWIARGGLVVALAALTVPAGGQAPAPAAGSVETRGTVEEVTVYRGQAMVTRRVEVDAPAGAVDLVVTDLPASIVPDSLHASAAGGVQIRAVRYRQRAVSDEPREEVRRLDQQIEETGKAIRENQALQAVLAQKQAYLDNLEKFTAEKSKDEMAKGVLNADTVKGVTEFLFQQRSVLAKESLLLKEGDKTLAEKLSLLQRQRKELAAQLSRSEREAMLFLDKPAGRATIHLHYLVSNASWSPMYNVRCGADRRQVALEYNALVQQMCGEDWNGVKLTLSTASPTMLAEAPVLAPLWVALSRQPPPAAQPDAALVLGGQKAAGEELQRAWRQRSSVYAGATAINPGDWEMNVAGNRLQMMDLVAGKDVLLAGREVRAAEEMLSVNYSLPGEISVPSRSDQQMIQIASLKLEGRFHYLAVPLLTPYVYQQAEMVNAGELALLSGPVSAYLDGQFMGGGRIPTVAKGQRFTVGFGVDTQLRSGRELADKSDRVQGGNRELQFQYRLLVQNYKEGPVKVRIMDRLPDPKGEEIRVTLGELKEPLWDDKVYQRTLRKMGILVWEIDVPAKAADGAARTLEYEYKLEFDKNTSLAEPTPVQMEAQKKEFMRAVEAMQAQ